MIDYDIKVLVRYREEVEDYSFSVLDKNSDRMGHLRKAPTSWKVGNTVSIDGELYIITRILGEPDYKSEIVERFSVELKKHDFQPDFSLEMKGVERLLKDRLKSSYQEQLEELMEEYTRVKTDTGKETIGLEMKRLEGKYKHLISLEEKSGDNLE